MRALTPLVAALVLLASAHALAHGPRHASRGPTADDVHEPAAIPGDVPTPALSLRLSRSAVGGFDLELLLERFSLQPAPASDASTGEPHARAGAPADGFAAGHGRLFVNGAELQRIGAPTVHLPATRLRPGINQITVRLATHASRDWTRGGRAVLATLFFDPERPGIEVYRFESFPVTSSSTRPD